MKLVPIDNSPVPSAVAPAIKAVQARVKKNHGYHPVINSAYRGDAAAKLLARFGKHTQRFLYQAFIRHVPGYYPANPPGFSTHELASDGVAYPNVRRGLPLRQWQQGFDFNDSAIPHVLEAARELGIPMFQPYPSGSEYHHVNFIRRPSRFMR